MNIQTSREELDKIIARYESYVALYRAVSGGDTAGITPFHVFYRRMTYDTKYSDVSALAQSKF